MFGDLNAGRRQTNTAPLWVQEESEGGEGGGGGYENSYAAHVFLSVGSCAITPVAFNPFNSV